MLKDIILCTLHQNELKILKNSKITYGQAEVRMSMKTGGDILCVSGYVYNKRTVNNASIRWNCTFSKKLRCEGAVTSSTDFQNLELRNFKAHCHPPDETTKEIISLRCTMRKNCRETEGSPSQILLTALYNVNDDVKANVGKMASVKRDMRRHRQQLFPTVPQKVKDLVIPLEWTSTGGKQSEEFLVHDNGPNKESRILIFGTQYSLKTLAASKMWFMDGTFKTAAIFSQLYVIHAMEGQVAYACLYIFLNRKTKAIYKSLLEVIRNKFSQMGEEERVNTIMLDFEGAAMQAITETFNERVEVKGCFFHLCQSTWRHVQSCGLVRAYRNDVEVRVYCGMLDALAFLPISDVTHGMLYIWETAPIELADLLLYFDRTYVSGEYQVGGEPKPPLFPPAIWNVRNAVLTESYKTNNISESWNNRFGHLVGRNNANFWHVLQAVRRDEAYQRTKRLMGADAVEAKRNAKQVQLRSYLLRKCREYDFLRMAEFLQSISKTLRH